MDTEPINEQRLAELRCLINANYNKLCAWALLGHMHGKNVLIVNADQKTRTLVSYSTFYDEALALLDEPYLIRTLQRLHSYKDHYTVLAYLYNKENHTYICTVAALHCTSISTAF